MKKKLFRLVENHTFRLNESVGSYNTTIIVTDPTTDEEHEVPVNIEYEYIPEERGSRERGTGAQLDPDTLESVEITSIVGTDGKNYDNLPLDQIGDLEKEILDNIKDSYDGDM